MRIILFDLDCLRPDHLGCYGYDRPTSPAIDAIAKEGTRFTNYYCADSPCLPSRAGFVSGRFGINNGVVSNFGAGARFEIRTKAYGGPAPDQEMLMRRLRSIGYDTISFSNFADRHFGMWFMCGWSEFHTPNLKGGNETAEEVAEPVIRWLKHNATRENYLLHINYWDAHRCYKMDASWADRFKDCPVTQEWPGDETTRRLAEEITGPFTATGQFRDGKSPFALMPDAVRSRKDFEHMITGYDASIAYVDHYVRIVLDELDRQGVLDDAVIIFTADHGDAFGEHGIYSDHVCADECIHRIPLVVRWPGVTKEDEECSSLLYNVDLSATLCDLLGAEIPATWDGQSFGANLRGEAGLERDYLVWGHALYTVQRAVRTRSHLMVRTYHSWQYSQFEPVELYDMEEDPYQTRNIRDDDPSILQRCDHHMNEWIHEQRTKKRTIPDPFDAVLNERVGER
ncbi:MAG: sulfatase [Planctomycetes bacterium]|nr:sulfatase [Planctomycetota bacterium]